MLIVILVRFAMIIILVLIFNINEGGIAMTILIIGVITLDIGTVNIDFNFNTC